MLKESGESKPNHEESRKDFETGAKKEAAKRHPLRNIVSKVLGLGNIMEKPTEDVIHEEANKENERRESEKMRARVDALGKIKYKNFIQALAENEDEFRELLKRGGTKNETVEEAANEFSTKDLQRIEAEEQKQIDDLTGLKRAVACAGDFFELLALEKRLENKNETKPPFQCSLLVIDFDNFKKINDTYGHDAGNTALKAMAEAIKRTVRASDIVYRFGGDEFVVLLPATDSSGAFEIGKKIGSEIKKLVIPISEGKELKDRTVSIGCAGTDQFPEKWENYNPDDMEAADKFLTVIFKAADSSAYISKEKGRDRTTRYVRKSKGDESLKQAA